MRDHVSHTRPQGLRRFFALVCAAATALSLWAPALASPALGDEIRQADTDIHTQTQLSTNVFWSTVFNDFRTENFITYRPNAQVRPIITYGEALTDVSTMTRAVRFLESEGLRVVGGINGDFYNMNNGLPMGLIVTDGKLRSSDAGYYAMGFRKDGTTIMGQPKLSITAGFGYRMDDGYGNMIEIVRPLAAVNKARVSTGGIYLYTYDFNGRHTTGNTEPGLDAVCTITGGSLAIGSSVKMRVERVVEATGVTPVGPNQIVLSVNLRSEEWYLKALRNLPRGSEITVTVSAADSAWNNIDSGLGALYCLAENGRISSGLTDGASPRTAVGRKADGTLIFYTIDGRQKGHSIGATLRQVAARLLELGCVTVLGLDGGGSTTISVTMPDSRTATTINSPSEGTERAVSNKIFLVAEGSPTGTLDHFYIRPDNAYVLSGSRVNLAVSAVDTNFFPMQHESTLTASDGTIEGTTLITPRRNAAVTVTAKGGNKTGSAVVHAVATPDTLTISDSGGTARTSLTLAPGASVQLSASAMYQHLPLHADSGVFSWTASGSAGTISESGLYSALTPGSGSITVAAGGRTATIPVTVSKVALKELENFEQLPSGDGAGAVLAIATGGEEARYGRSSGELRYDLGDTGIAQWRYTHPIAAPGIPYDMVTLWLQGDGSGNKFVLLARDGSGTESRIPAATLDFTGWQQITVLMGGTNLSLAGFAVTEPDYEEGASLLADEDPAVTEHTYDESGEILPAPGMDESSQITAQNNEEAVLAASEEGGGRAGILLLDQIVATYDGIVDSVPPVVTASRSGWTVSAQVRDEQDGVLPASAVTVYYNGGAVNGNYNPANGTVSFPLPGPGESYPPMRVTVSAQDASGNIARSSVDIPPAHYPHRFTDIDGYWAADYIDFLASRNVAVPYADGTYRPYVDITRAEFAVMLARAAGYDGRNYAHVELPYADLDQIPDSALPALRALYAENVMRGTEGEDGRLYLRPNQSLTRAQASAMIGRSQKLGYGSTDMPFPDADQIPAYAASHIRTMVARGILAGFSDGTFRPHSSITRGQMAKILYFLA